MNISIVMAFPTRQQVLQLDVDATCTARQAVDLAIAAGLDTTDDGFNVDQAPLGVFGERVADDAQLSAGDRVEIYRPLQQDPMELRRQRAASEAGRLPKRRK